MADQKISQLVELGSLPGSSKFAVAYQGQTYYADTQFLKTIFRKIYLYDQSAGNPLAATTAVIIEETLFTTVLGADTLGVDGDILKVRAWGKYAANANTKQVRFKFGAYTFDGTLHSVNNRTFDVEIAIHRLTSATQQVFSNITESGVGAYSANRLSEISNEAEDLTTVLTISLTGQNGVAAANDIELHGWEIVVQTGL